MVRNPLFYDGTLDLAAYRTSLDRWAARPVILPAANADHGGIGEQALIERGLPDQV